MFKCGERHAIFQKGFEIRFLPSAHHLKRTFDPDVTYEQIAWVLGKAHWKATVKIVETNYNTESWTKFLARRRHVPTISSLSMRFGKTSMRLGQPLVALELLHAVRRFHSYTHMLHNICPWGPCVRMWACASVLCTQVDGYVDMSSRMHARRICPYSCLCLCTCAYFSIVPLCLMLRI